MTDAEALFAVLRKSADADAVSAIERLVQDGQDRALSRVNAVDFAAQTGLLAMLRESGLSAVRQQRALRGIANALEVYEIP